MSWIDDTGLNLPTLDETVTTISNGFKKIWGVNTDTAQDGTNGELIAFISELFSGLYELGQDIWSAHDPAQATGISLDILASLKNLKRKAATACSASCCCYAAYTNLPVTISSGCTVIRTRNSQSFSSSADQEISTSSIEDIYFKASDAFAEAAVMTLAFSFGTVTYTVPSGGTALVALTALKTAIEEIADFGGTVEIITSSDDVPDNAQDPAVYPALRIVWPGNPFTVSFSGVLTCVLVGTPLMFYCDAAGTETATAGEITTIGSPSVDGWTGVYNLVDASEGTVDETDAALRIRIAEISEYGYATEEAIRNRLLNDVDGVTSVSVVSNRTLITDSDGLPGKSFMVLINGGENADIAAKIWEVMPEGIENWADSTSSGYRAYTIQDSDDQDQKIVFMRPVTLYLWVQITYTLYDEETFPTDGETDIKDAVVTWASSEYVAGKDIIPDRIKAPIYDSVTGISNLSIKVALTTSASDTPTYSDAILSVSAMNIALANADRIEVIQG